MTYLRRLLAVSCLIIGSCSSDGLENGRASQERVAANHAVRSAQLRSLMSGMGSDVQQMWPQEIAALKEKQARQASGDEFERAARAAAHLANTAHTIPQAVPESVLSGPDRQRFMKLVAQLESNARGVESRAAANDASGMQTALHQLETTCSSCHNQFREVAGPLR